jgi:hypothetical protein
VRVQVTFESANVASVQGLDGAVAVVYQDDRPMRGTGAHADWRLNGFLSRLLQGGKFAGEAGEWLLVHTQNRLPFTHLFLVGMGRREQCDAKRVRQAIEGIAAKVALAGLHAFAIDLTEVAGEGVPASEAMMLFLETLGQAYPDDELSNPPYRPAIEVEERNRERLDTARRRRAELLAARARMAAKQALDAREADDEEADDEEADDAEATADRPIAGGLPPAATQDAVETESSSAPEELPDPDSLPAPDLEARPERTVKVVFVGTADRLAEMRRGLQEADHAGSTGSLDVSWSR